MNIRLSVVDQSPVHGSHSKQQAPHLTLELARLCDELGYHRYWVAEHHDSQHFANPCPEIMVGAVAAVTRRMRIGSGGVMLSHYSPYKVAECFRMLATLYPDRIDLGVGRAPGGTGLASRALAFPYSPHHGDLYPQQAQMLSGFLRDGLPDQNPFHSLRVMPDNEPTPELWMLGSSGGSAGLAGHLGYNLALARFIDPDNCKPDIFAEYDAQWREAGHEGKGNRMLAIACICADSDEEARLVAGTAVYRKLAAQSGLREDFLTPEQVRDRYQQLSKSQQAMFDHIEAGYTIGSPQRCMDEIRTLASAFDCQEVALVTVTWSQQARMDSYRLLAGML
ncbi:MsnO8 family LLM class oxidoreductase [Parathalassolituus penaei]|uniref:MsnO8 family LLM class oxidoreductase n=1 Tax=Parathalassolituus penaei TaxID=2997323 RepID=A0A9X3IR40_9GAMM|nr:MsnO8 family LLM class oxidoreductase [Parathalassolituus penaei]MCY0963830.1 MsnO8 family LLM class oxidoreductase [Parathalassolituus penaei]